MCERLKAVNIVLAAGFTATLLFAAVVGGNHTSKQSVAGTTTSALDMTGTTLIVAQAATFGAGSPACTAGTITDSEMNTYTCIENSVSSNNNVAIWYKCGPTVSASMTFTITGLTSFPTIFVRGYSGTETMSCLDVHNKNTSSSSATVTTGSVTPSQANSLLVAVLGNTINNTFSISAPFTVQEQQPNTIGMAGAYADEIQTGTSARNPTFTNGGGTTDNNAAAIAVFKPAGGGAPAMIQRTGGGFF